MSCGCGLTLERWRQILSYNPYHFWGLSNASIPVNSNCNTLMREYAWQHVQQLGREDIREAIRLAEQRLAEHLHYYPYPRYIEEVIPLHQNMWGYGWGCGDKCVSVRLTYGRVIAFGIEGYGQVEPTVIGAGVELIGGLGSAWTADIAGLNFDIDDLYVYPGALELPFFYQPTSQSGIECKWLSPILRATNDNSDPDAPFTTIYATLGTTVQPVLWEGVQGNNTAGLNPNTASNFIQSPRFYRPFTDNSGVTTDTASVIFEYDNPCHCGCDCNGDLPYERLGQGVMKDARTGEVNLYLATYDPETETWSTSGLCECRTPDRVRVRYYAGDDNGCKWDEVVARLAISELTRRPCGCNTMIDEFSRWYTDRALVDPNKSFAFKEDDLGNPLGTRAGAIYAWQRVKQLMMIRGTRV